MKEGIRILVGIDGSEHSMWVLVEASNVAKKFSGSVKAITVYKQGTEEDAEKILQKAQRFLETEGVEFTLSAILGSNPSRALVDAAKNENSDLVVVGSRELGSAAAFLLGSVSKEVVSKASCDVLVVKK